MQLLLEQALLSKYGDLEAVWAQGAAALQQSLFDLPLLAMELLLASDKLKVSPACEPLYSHFTATIHGRMLLSCGLERVE